MIISEIISIFAKNLKMEEIIEIMNVLRVIIIVLVIIGVFLIFKGAMPNLRSLYESIVRYHKPKKKQFMTRVYNFYDLPYRDCSDVYYHPYINVEKGMSKEDCMDIYNHIKTATDIYYIINNNILYCVYKDYKFGYVRLLIDIINCLDRVNKFQFCIIDNRTAYTFKDEDRFTYRKTNEAFYMKNFCPELFDLLKTYNDFAFNEFKSELK